MFALIAALLALAGAPAGTPVSCVAGTAVTPDGRPGSAYTLLQPGVPGSIVLSRWVCRELTSKRADNQALAEWVVLREAVHVQTASADECLDDRVALPLLPRLVPDPAARRWVLGEQVLWAAEMGCPS